MTLGTGSQEQVPNHLRRLWLKAKVVNAEGKCSEFTGSGDGQEEDRKEPLMKCRNEIDDVQNRSLISPSCAVSEPYHDRLLGIKQAA